MSITDYVLMSLLVHLAKKLSNYNFKARKFASFLIIAMVISPFFCNSQCILFRICHKKTAVHKPLQYPQNWGQLVLAHSSYGAKQYVMGNWKQLSTLSVQTSNKKRKDKAFKYYDIKGKGFKVYFV